MDMKADVTLPFPREKVFTTYRDRLIDLTDYLPNIRRIRVLKREDFGDEVRMANEWTGGGDIPQAALAVLKESMMRWTDYATWKTSSHTVEWRTESYGAPGFVQSSGFNRFIEVPKGTRLEIRGSLVCDPSKLPGVPRMLAGPLSGVVERFLVGQVQVNLVEVGKGVGRLLEHEGR